jgi:adenosylhomocysteine nucleosidase
MSRAPIGILCALAEESELLLGALRSARVATGAALDARIGLLDGHAVVVASAGVGKVNAAVSATLLVERLGCRALLLSGVAGGLDASLDIGALVVAARVVDVDFGRLTDAGRVAYQPGIAPLPGVKAEPGYQLSPALAAAIAARCEAAGIAATLGTVLSGDAFLASARVRDELAARWSAVAIEMEAAGVCGVAARFDLPWLVVRALSDRAGEESVTDFPAFLASAAARASTLVRALLPVVEPDGPMSA